MGTTALKSDFYKKLTKVASTIQINGAPTSTESAEHAQLDEIDASAHETFTLEEMRSLIMTYKKTNKDFIIARVTTPDPDNQSVFYNFYYSATEINRILFRYEPSRRLLHRMKVKNPLNNMFIIGQVFYYKITPAEVDRAIVNYYFNSNQQKKKSRKAFSAIFRHNHTFFDHDKSAKSKDSMYLDEKYDGTEKLNEKQHSEIIEKMIKGEIEMPKEISEDRKICYSAKYFASDDDFLIKQDIREYFKRNAIDPEDDFIYELDRTQNDFMALLDEESGEEDEEVSEWRRVLSAHVSFALMLIFICLLIGTGPIIALIFLPAAILLFLSFLMSLCYVLCCRRGSFDTIAVNSVEEEL